jgi:hypothetical protein
MANRFLERMLPSKPKNSVMSFLHKVISGSLFKMSDLRGQTSLADIKTKIDMMRALAIDSQISTALSYYATDATTFNSDNQIIWATSKTDPDVADIINQLFKRWDINSFARDHILELATIGNLFIPTTDMYKVEGRSTSRNLVALDNNTIPDENFDIVPSYKIPPEQIVHLWFQGQPEGYMMQPEDNMQQFINYPESAIIHFSLGGLLGEYTLDTVLTDGTEKQFDIMFAEPLMVRAVQPTQVLSLLEDALMLASLTRVVKFINVECGNAEEEEIRATLQELKDAIEQQLAINTNTGDTQSFVNPQSPNNLIFLPKIGGVDAISVTDLNMSESNETDNNLLQYYQDKKLSVLGVPKEAMNFSSNEGLGGAGTVLAQRSQIYANSLQRLMTAYKAGWTKAINTRFEVLGFSGMVDKFELHMNPILTTQSTLTFEKRDAALNQARTLFDLLREMGVAETRTYQDALVEVLAEVFPQIGSQIRKWNIDLASGEEGEGGGLGEF